MRVYWHGDFPDPRKVGTLMERGTIRHEVMWDGNDQRRSLIPASSLMDVNKFGQCCAYCAALRKRGDDAPH